MKISSALVRYVFPAVLLLAFIAITERKAYAELAAHFDSKAFITVSIVGVAILGVILHHIYHLLYSYAFTRFQDKYRINSDSYRTWLSKRYGINTDQAMSLFRFVRDKYFSDIYTEKMETTGATIHLMYFSFVLSVVFAVANAWLINLGNVLTFTLIGAVSLMSGFFLDRKYEEKELHFVLDIDESILDEAAHRLFGVTAPGKQIVTPNTHTEAD